MNWIEWFGYFASILVALSLTMSNIRYLRWFNLAGAASFTLYGYLLDVYPVMVVNAFIMGINTYYLVRMARTRDRFHLIPISWETSIFLPRFVDFYQHDILKHFPDLDLKELREKECVLITRNVIPVGLFAFERHEYGVIQIHLDYVIPMYRDYENARYLFREFRSMPGMNSYSIYKSYCREPSHQRYLRRMKFHPVDEEKGLFVRNV